MPVRRVGGDPVAALAVAHRFRQGVLDEDFDEAAKQAGAGSGTMSWAIAGSYVAFCVDSAALEKRRTYSRDIAAGLYYLPRGSFAVRKGNQ